MNKKIFLITIFLLLLFPKVIYGQMELKSEQNGQTTILSIESRYKQEEGTVKVYDDYRIFFINQFTTDEQGHFQIELKLPTDRPCKVKVNIRGEAKEILMDKGESEAPIVTSKHINMIIQGYDGTILPRKTIEINEGDSVLDALRKGCQENGIQLYYENTGYVLSIEGLSQGDKGPLSGWKYDVNGHNPGLASSDYNLNGGEDILWYFVKTPSNTSTETGFLMEDIFQGGEISYNHKNEGQITFTIADNEKKQVSFSFPRGMTSEMEQKGIQWVIIDTGTIQIKIPAIVINNIEEIGSGTITLTIEEVGKEDLSEKEKSYFSEASHISEDFHGYNFRLTHDGMPMKYFKNPIEIEIPFQENVENQDNITIFYLGENSSATEIIGGKYHSKTQTVRFITNHFSLFYAGEHKISFTDVDKDMGLVKSAIEEMACQGIIKGISKDHFNPHGYVSRPEMAAMIVRMMKYSVLPDRMTFEDVDSDAWYYGSVQAISQNGIMAGYSQEEFGTGELTWQELDKIIKRVLLQKGKNAEVYSDKIADNNKVTRAECTVIIKWLYDILMK